MPTTTIITAIGMSTRTEAQDGALAALEQVDIRVGTVVEALPFPEARKPAVKLRIDFGGTIGLRWSSAQITANYAPEALVGRQVVAAVNLGPRRIGPFTSEVLTMGLPDEGGAVVLVAPDRAVPNGGRLY